VLNLLYSLKIEDIHKHERGGDGGDRACIFHLEGSIKEQLCRIKDRIQEMVC